MNYARLERLKRGWTQSQVAKMVGASTGYIQAIESCRIYVFGHGRVMKALSELYGIPAEKLCKYVHDPKEFDEAIEMAREHLRRAQEEKLRAREERRKAKENKLNAWETEASEASKGA